MPAQTPAEIASANPHIPDFPKRASNSGITPVLADARLFFGVP